MFLCFYSEAPRILGVLSADVSRDGDANLSCIVSCYPPSNITWKLKGKNLTRSANYEFIDSSYMLKVKNVQFVDAGPYECSLINEPGEARANASLTVGCECKLTVVRETVNVFLSVQKHFLPFTDINLKQKSAMKLNK